ncbi:MAG: hypothetical protein GY811_12485 [Myxococcales bacterium]|nr:hypothetical protein [Myxococcales bacterium]
MQARYLGIFVALILVTGSAAKASAQYSVPSQATRSSSNPIEIARGPIEAVRRKPPQLPWEIGTSLTFVTSKESLTGQELAFTDVMLLRLHAMVSLGRFEVFGGTDILPKQPSYTNEHIWQGSLAGVRTVLDKNISVWARGQGGPQLDKSGFWAGADAAAQYRYELQDVLFFETALGLSHTHLFFKEDVGREYFLDEVFTSVGLALHDPGHGKFGMWLNFDYYYPVFHRPTTGTPDPETLGALDPQPRVNMHIGALGAITENVSLFIEYSILDRGAQETETTTLPVLNTGFDQRQIIFGFMRHFGG